MKELVVKTGREYQETEAKVREIEVPRLVRRKLTAAAQREREELTALGNYGSDEESDIMESTMSADKEYSNHHHQKQARMDSELVQWNIFGLSEVNSPL